MMGRTTSLLGASVALLCLILMISPATARRERTPASGPILVGERRIERFVLLQTIHVNHPLLTRRENGEYWILPGQFIPVSEDADGVYFQATSGLRVFAGNREPQPVSGGLYVRKKTPRDIFRYFGDARNSAAGIDIDTIPLSADYVRLLKVARAAKGER